VIADLVWGGFVIVLLAAFVGLPLHLRRHPEHRGPGTGASAGLVGSVDDVFHPEAHAAQLALDAQQRWVEPAPTPDGDRGIRDDGRIRITLPRA
jgi:hypothetical protein